MLNKYRLALSETLDCRRFKCNLMRSVLMILLLTGCFISCKKGNDSACSPIPPEDESAQITTFCNAHTINYTVDSNGIYYQVVDQGSGAKPAMNSTVTVTYTTATLDGNIIEDNTVTPVTKPLSDFIEGWRLALPYLQKGGRMKMVVPSALAYGCTGISNLIPPNTPLYYDVVLINVE